MLAVPNGHEQRRYRCNKPKSARSAGMPSSANHCRHATSPVVFRLDCHRIWVTPAKNVRVSSFISQIKSRVDFIVSQSAMGAEPIGSKVVSTVLPVNQAL